MVSGAVLERPCGAARIPWAPGAACAITPPTMPGRQGN